MDYLKGRQGIHSEQVIQEIKEELEEAFEEKDFEKVQEIILEYFLHESLGLYNEVMDDHVYIPEWEMSIKVVVNNLKDQMANLGFLINASSFERELYELSSGIGESLYAAVSNAVDGFLLCFMSGIHNLQNDNRDDEFVSEFLGKKTHWKMYSSDVVILGQKAANYREFHFWEIFAPDIVKRLGNQDMVYVKLYGAKVNGKATGECRIGDVKIEEISKKMEEIAQKWDVDGFSSNKQFFFLKRAEEELPQNRYFGEEGREELKSNLVSAIQVFMQCDTEEKFEQYERFALRHFDDLTLAYECRHFLPEICAEYAFQQDVTFSEQMIFCYPDDTQITLYKSQLADYYDLKKLFFEILNEELVDNPDGVYGGFISISAIYSVIKKVQKENKSFEGARFAPLFFNVEEDFEIR